MTTNPNLAEWPELLEQLRKLTELVDPLRAMLAAETTPDLTQRIEGFLSEVHRIADQMERAVSAMEADPGSRAAIERIEKRLEMQEREMTQMATHLDTILGLFGSPPDAPEPS